MWICAVMILPGENKLGDLQLGRSLLEDERRRLWKHRVSQVLWHHISYHHRQISNPSSINVMFFFFFRRAIHFGEEEKSREARPVSLIRYQMSSSPSLMLFSISTIVGVFLNPILFLFLVWRTFSTSPLNPRTLQRFSCFLSRFCKSQMFRFLAVRDVFQYCCCRCSRWRLTMIQQNQ